MSREPYLKAYVDPIFDSTSDPNAVSSAAAYVGNFGTFSILRQGVADYCLYIHDERTAGGTLIACTSGGGGGGNPATLIYDPNDYTLTFNNGAGQVVVFDSGELSTDAGNTLTRGSDGGIYSAPVAVPDTVERITGTLSGAITTPPAGVNGLVYLAPSGVPDTTHLIYDLDDGASEGQRLTVMLEHTDTLYSRHEISYAGGVLRTVNSFGIPTQNSTLVLKPGRSYEFVWSDGSQAPEGWFITADRDPLGVDSKLVFSGIVRPFTTMPAGWGNVFIIPAYDPKGLWDFATRSWLMPPEHASYRVEVTMLGCPPTGPEFSRIELLSGPDAVTVTLPPIFTAPDEYSFHWSGHVINRGAAMEPSTMITSMRLFNVTGTTVTFDPADPYLALGRWQLNIYETNT